MKCNACNKELQSELYFCNECGSLMRDLGVGSEYLKQSTETRMKEFLTNVQNNEFKSDILWDQTINRYVKNISKMKTIMSQKDIEKSVQDGLLRNMNTFIDKCRTPEFHIAFVGAIKAGKSTLINALLGKNLASTSVTPETAVLTKFRAAKGKNYLKLTFYNAYEWNELWQSVHDSKSKLFLEEYAALNAAAEKDKWVGQPESVAHFETIEALKTEIELWTSSKKATHYFVKEVEVGLIDFNLPEQVVFVDTPGLDDAVRYRSDVTRRYIDRANAVFACVKSDAMTGQELSTLYRVFSNTRYNPEKVYVIGTQWDTLTRPEENWKEQKAEWAKYLRQDDCYGNAILADKNVFSVAAFIYNLVNDFDKLDEDSLIDLESIALKFRIRKVEENLDKLKELSNVDYLKHVLNTEIVAKYKEYLYQDFEQSYLDNKADIKLFFANLRENNLKLLEVANSDINKIQEEREKSKQELEAITKQRENLMQTLKLVRKSTNDRVEELCAQIRKLGDR